MMFVIEEMKEKVEKHLKREKMSLLFLERRKCFIIDENEENGCTTKQEVNNYYRVKKVTTQNLSRK